jgi:hypothetical protein
VNQEVGVLESGEQGRPRQVPYAAGRLPAQLQNVTGLWRFCISYQNELGIFEAKIVPGLQKMMNALSPANASHKNGARWARAAGPLSWPEVVGIDGRVNAEDSFASYA